MPTLPGAPFTGIRPGVSTAAVLLAVVVPVAKPDAARATQGANYELPPAEIERRLRTEPFQIAGMVDNRWEGDRTQRTALRFRDGVVLPVKWARSEPGGFALNNQPAYELAAYRLQELFLDAEHRVVPPTALRVMPLEVYRQLDPRLGPTFPGTSSVLVVVQYWLQEVEPLIRPDSARLHDDDYARALGHLNILTYLIRHADSNQGNVLVSTNGEPRMFAVDNGVAFTSPDSPRGTLWKDLHVKRLPASAVERLRRLDRGALARALSVLAELHVDADGRLQAAEPGPRRNPDRGVHFADGIVQLGLTDREIDGVWARLQELIRRVDAGEITTF